MCDTVRDWKAIVHNWVRNVMQDQGIVEYDTHISGSSGKGEGYIGDITFVKITGKDKIGATKQFEYVIKSGKDNDILRKQAPIDDAYINETYFYTEILPIITKFQKDHNIKKPFKHVPPFVGHTVCDGIDVIILENLKVKGFDVYDKNKPMDLPHLKMIFEHYGKWHAVSYAMREYEPKLFNKLSGNLKNVFRGFMDEGGIVEPMAEVVNSVYSLFEDEPEVLKKYKKVAQEAKHVFLHLIDKSDPCNVMSHGDCWNNNFLFAHEGPDKSKPTEVCFLDWQLSTLCSPVYDLSYNLYVCASKKELDHFDELLQTYHQSLAENLRQFGCDPDKIFPYEKLMEQWKKYGKYGFLFSIYVLTFVLCTKDEAPDLNNANQDEGFKALMHIKIKDNPLYNQRVRDIVHHFVDRFID